MGALKSLAQRMMALLTGNTDLHYTADYRNVTLEKNGKRVPQYDDVPGAPTIKEFEDHLAGKKGLLVIPVTRAGSCRWGKIDVDVYPCDGANFALKIHRFGLPLVVEFSKSTGIHLAHYSPITISATEMREKLFEWAIMLGCSTKVEIFPKQERLMEGEAGSGINLPYFNGDKGTQCAVNKDGRKLTVEEWLDLAEHLPAKALYTPGEPNVEAAVDFLVQHWTDGQRDNLNLAAAGAMLRAGLDESVVAQIIEQTQSAAADNEKRRSVESIAVALSDTDANKKIPGFTKLVELMGNRDTAQEFMKLAGARPPPDPLPFQLITVAANWLNEAPPPLTYTIEPLLPTGVVGMVVAEGGAGKTTFNLRMAVAIAGGRSLFDLPTVRGRVVYIGAEEHASSLRRRLYWIFTNERRRMQESGASPEAIETFEASLRENLTVQSVVGHELHLVNAFGGEAKQSLTLGALIDKLPQPLELLILDPISRLNGAEENSNAVGTALINAAERIARERNCTLLLAHHTGKASAKERDDTMYSARGASAFVDAARSVMRLIQASPEDCRHFSNCPPEVVARGDVVRVVHNKSNEGPKAKEFWLRRQALDFERFNPELMEGGAHHAALLTCLFTWACGANDRKPFSRSRMDDVETRRDAFSPHKVGRDQARGLITRALDEGDLRPSLATGERSAHMLMVFRPDFGNDL